MSSSGSSSTINSRAGASDKGCGVSDQDPASFAGNASDVVKPIATMPPFVARPPAGWEVSSGFALPAALTLSALLLISSLSLQTLAMHQQQRGRQRWHTATQQDAVRSAAMDFAQRASGAEACLLAWPSEQWSQLAACGAADPQALRSGQADGLAWILKRWQPGQSIGRLSLHIAELGSAAIDLAWSEAGVQQVGLP
ncbi:MAG: hypothetical protein CL862_09940 [Cyanobium sp. NAT70]|nr:hypothetical protein [Cyanobium sp. NAT70]